MHVSNNQSPQRVLIVEDDFLVGEKLHGILEDSGYEIVGDTASGRQAIEMTARLRPDVVMMDLNLLDMDGLTAAKHITAQCPTPIIALTAYEDAQLVGLAKESGISYYLVKPASHRDVSRAIQIATARFNDLMQVRKLNAALEEENIKRKRAEAALQDTLAQARQREREIRWLLEASQAVMACHTFEEAARRIFDVAREATGAVSGYVAMMSEDGGENELLFLESGGLPCDVDPDLPMPIRGLRAEAYTTATVVYDNDFENSQWMKFIPSNHVEMRNVMFAPLVIGEGAVGVMGLANKPAAFTPEDARLAKAFGDMAAIALQRTQVEDTLREREKLLRTTGQMAEIGGWELDAKTQQITWTEQTYHIHGLPLDYAPPLEGAIAFFHPEDQDKLMQAIQHALDEGQPYDMELRFFTTEGEPRWVRTQCRPQIIDGKPHKLEGTIQDITARKEAEIQLQGYANHLEEMVEEKMRALEEARVKEIQMDKMAALGEMATGIAHELNQPLTAITFEADYLKTFASRLPASEQSIEESAGILSESATNLEGDVERCRRIVDHLRTFGRIAQDPPQTIDINQPISNSFILAGARLRHREVDVRLDLANNLPSILSDPYKLEQVFLNLISNAEYAMEKRAEHEPKPDYHKVLEITTAREDEHVIARVRDNGCGISPEIRARIFDPFFTTKPEGDGTGLGLSISYGIVTDADGDIECESVVGEGTTFTLRFPVNS